MLRRLLFCAVFLGFFSFVSGCFSDSHQHSVSGYLHIQAKGEDFVRQSFNVQDGWGFDFGHAYVHLADVALYQTAPLLDPGASIPMQVTVEAILFKAARSPDNLQIFDIALSDLGHISDGHYRSEVVTSLG